MTTLRKGNLCGFSLIELMVVIATIVMLVSILMPSLDRAKLLARVTRVRAELQTIDISLQTYKMDHEAIPPVRVDCNADMRGHEYQLPVELADGGYLPKGADLQTMVAVEDPFNPDHTYKYNAPGPLVMNNSLVEKGNYLWVPDEYPDDPGSVLTRARGEGTRYNDPDICPVKWVIWSVGPGGPDSPKAASSRCPTSSRTWYDPAERQGIICRILAADGLTHLSQ